MALFDTIPTGVSQAPNEAFVRKTQSNELTSTNLNNILAQGGDYIQNAQSRGQEVAAGRGLLNSSIASGAAERAAIEAAAPIAAQDASAYRSAASENLNYLNQRDIVNQQDELSRFQIETDDATRRYGIDTQDATNRYGIDIGAETARYQADASANATLGAASISANAARSNLQAQLAHNSQQADLERMHGITMRNLAFDQNLAAMAASHDLDLDQLAARSFYDIQQMAALDNLAVRDQGMSFVMGAYNNYTGMVQNALTGDFDAAAMSRLLQTAGNYLDGSITFGGELFSSFPPFDFEFQNYGG